MYNQEGYHKHIEPSLFFNKYFPKLNYTIITLWVMSLSAITPIPDLCDPISNKTGCNNCTQRGPCPPEPSPFDQTFLLAIGADGVTLECSVGGHCVRGSVPIDPWLSYALKTQREIQVDEEFTKLQLFDAHNAFNNRADGYGVYDNCNWPPPYDPRCVSFTNQEFSMTDLLNMGVRGLEIDIWWCYDELRMAHLNLEYSFKCLPSNRLFKDGIKEIADWLAVSGNENEILRLYINEKENISRDSVVNEAIRSNLGNRVLTPYDLRETFQNNWPTMRRMRETGKTVVITNSNSDFLHGGEYFHPSYWIDLSTKNFDGYPNCGGRTDNTTFRFRGDATKYASFYTGPDERGLITSLTEFTRCGTEFPAGDMITPDLMRTGVWTWAEDEPSIELKSTSCIFLRNSTRRWYATNECDRNLKIACQSNTSPDEWMLGETSSAGDEKECNGDYSYSIPKNGFQQEKIFELMIMADENDVWINYDAWLPDSSSGSVTGSGSNTGSGSDTDAAVSTFSKTLTYLFLQVFCALGVYYIS